MDLAVGGRCLVDQGPIELIAGTDLAARTVDPGDILQFISGQLDQQYVGDEYSLDRADRGMDLACDPDGRYRVNETYCHANTWQKAVQLLLGHSDKVLMDLRGFSSNNVGCVFELEQLFEHLPTSSIFLIVDRSTDFTQLGPVLERAWSRVSPSVLARGHDAVNLVRIEKSGMAEAQLLLKCLAGIIVPKRAVALESLAAAIPAG